MSYSKAWQLLSKTAVMALTYDERLVPPQILQEQRDRLDAALRRGMGRILSTKLSDTAWKRAALPAQFGGLSLRAANADLASVAFWSAADLHQAVLPSLADALGFDLAGIHPDSDAAVEARKTS